MLRHPDRDLSLLLAAQRNLIIGNLALKAAPYVSLSVYKERQSSA